MTTDNYGYKYGGHPLRQGSWKRKAHSPNVPANNSLVRGRFPTATEPGRLSASLKNACFHSPFFLVLRSNRTTAISVRKSSLGGNPGRLPRRALTKAANRAYWSNRDC